MVSEEVIAFIERIRRQSKTLSEAATSQAIVIPLLQTLDWDVVNVDEVYPQYVVDKRKPDYRLKPQNSTHAVLIEVKRSGENLKNHQRQWLEYAFQVGDELAILTNGDNWWFYLPLKTGDWESRRFCIINIREQDIGYAAARFIELLSKGNVASGVALEVANIIFDEEKRKKVIKATIPEAWEKIVSEPNAVLVTILTKETESLCGYKPEETQVRRFLAGMPQAGPSLVKPVVKTVMTEYTPPRSVSAGEPPEGETKGTRTRERVPEGTKMTSDETIRKAIIVVLQRFGGRAPAKMVRTEVFEECPEECCDSLTDWEVRISRERLNLKLDGLIKPPEESGRGIWELTEKGMGYKV